MKIRTVAFFIFMSLFCSFAIANADETTHKAVAEELLLLTNSDDMMKQVWAQVGGMMDQQFQQMGAPEELKPLFKKYTDKMFKLMEKEYSFANMKDDLITIYVNTYTEDEIREMILGGESEILEIKSTLRFDLREENVNKKLEYVITKTISAFLNSDGGTLIIGVDDDGNILGLEKDMKTLAKQNIDGFELHLRQVINKYLGEYFEKYLKISFSKIDGKEVCVIKISKSGSPVFINYEGNDSFFVRNGNASIPKNRKEQSEYEKLHWN